jgi:CxxC-x17-CxxC domain-containing protein
MADQQLSCRDCGMSFAFSEGEQSFYQERGLAAPQRCKDCRNKRKQERFSTRQMFPATCGKCGNACEVPFRPRPESEGGRPVLCLACFKVERGGDNNSNNYAGSENMMAA